jgi:glycosyltransferase involved in cell wall biosynthesis
VREAVASACGQTLADIEIIVVDDGGTDDTEPVIASIGDKRVKYFKRPHAGVSAARNFGVSMSSGRYVSFLDSDDLWLPEKLEEQISFMNGLGHKAICQTEEVWMKDGKRINPSPHHRKQSGWIFPACIPLCIVSPSAVMMVRDIFDEVGGFDETFPACEDYDMWLRVSLRYPIYTMARPLIIKRGGHGDQLSAAWGLDRYRIYALQKILGDPLITDEYRTLVEDDIRRRAVILCDGAKKRGNADVLREFGPLCQ